MASVSGLSVSGLSSMSIFYFYLITFALLPVSCTWPYMAWKVHVNNSGVQIFYIYMSFMSYIFLSSMMSIFYICIYG